MTRLTPPAAIQQGRKDMQYFPRELGTNDAVGIILAQVIKDGGTIEIPDWDKINSGIQAAIENNLKLVLWQPVVKNNLGDIAFNELGAALPGKGPYYIQIVEGPKIPAQPEDQGNLVEMPAPKVVKPQ